MKHKLRRRDQLSPLTYAIVLTVGILMLFPIVWMFFATFKTNNEIFGTLKLFPSSWSIQPYIDGWNVNGRITYSTFFINSFRLTLITTLITVCVALLIAYGFARFNFPFKKLLFTIMISTLMLPNAVLMIPRYSIFNSLNVLDSYVPFYLQAALGCYPFFIFMLVQFLRGVPRELDESAYIDGSNEIGVLVRILLPLLKPALFSAALFQFMWTYNDYTNVLIYINSVKKYTLSLALRLSLDAESVVQWNKVMAMSFLSILPLGILFFAAQKYFVEGMMAGALKG